MTENKKFWNVKTDGNKSHIDLFGYVGGSKEADFFEPEGFNEKEFLDELRAIPQDNALEISINSFGGSVYTGLSIYTLLKAHKGEITFRVDGAAMSAATIITSVPNAKVIMPKGSMMMIHKISSIAIGNIDDMRKAADDMEKLEQNILDIYAEKTGKTVDEIKPVVDAETYFTAAEAVEFGLADEVDENTAVENKAVGEIVMLNGLEVSARLFEHAPKGFLKADMPKASAVVNPAEKESETMDLETLKAEHPDIVEAIRNEALNEGIAQERARIQAIEEIAVAGHEEMVNAAKFDNAITAEQLAVNILKADKARNAAMLKNRAADAEDLTGITPDANEGLSPNAEAKKKEDAEEQAIIEAGARGFARK
jgi:ATP-dependent protease ClpP protease subunit